MGLHYLVYVWDENKREANLVKHGLDFADSALVYENPDKLTLISTRQREKRYADSPLVQLAGSCLTLVYIERGIDIRVISFRPSSRRERKSLAGAGKPN